MRRYPTRCYGPAVDPLTLDELDRQLVHALQIDGRAAFSHVAAVLGTSDRTIARRYRRLRSAGAVRVVGLPDGRHLGHVDWLVRLRCTPDAATAVAAALARRQDTSWVSLISGGTEITCITRTGGAAKDGELLLQKLPRTPRITAVTAHCLLRAVAGTGGWPGRTAALDPRQIDDLRPAPTSSSRSGHDVELTDADDQLLAELAKDGRTSHPDLARATGWSETTVRRRLDLLRRTGILHFAVEADPSLFGHTAEAMLWLTIAPAALTTVTQALSTHPEIGFAAATTGPANVVAFVVCRDADALYDYLATRIGALDGVLQAETAPVVRRVKGAGTLLVPPMR
ncbi:AsnC family transcriptional regulator [Nonomuraea sp. RK-328]|nr:AsnC family transcriptional regulator [Nonomuraea sp. RK-328]